MSALYDGNRKINTIHILGMYRQNEAYLSFLFKRFHEWEVYYHDVTFIYYFLENNSKSEKKIIIKKSSF